MSRLLGLLPVLIMALSPGPVSGMEPGSDAEPVQPVSGAAESGFEAPNEVGFNLIYSVNRTPEDPFDTARAVQVITQQDIWRAGARNLPEVLMEEAGIFVQQTNYGGGAPIIRGMIGKQLLILIDGVRLNNSTYRFGPSQYLATVDLNAVERIEVIRGAGTVLGSDALGGTINIITRKGPVAGEADLLEGSVYARHSTADQAWTAHVDGSGRTDKFRYLVGGTYRYSDDVVGGLHMGAQTATGYDEVAGNVNLEYFIDEGRSLMASYMILEQDDVPRTDRIFDGTNLRFDFDPQRLQLATLRFQDLTGYSPWLDAIMATVSVTNQDEGRLEIRSVKPTAERNLDDRQITLGTNLELASSLDFDHLLGSHRFVYGLDYSRDWIDSGRNDLDLLTGVSTPKRGNFTDGAKYDLFAAYLQDRFDVGKYLTVTAGTRYNYFSADGSEATSVGVLDLDGSDDSVTWAFGTVFHLHDALNLTGQVTQGYRAPNLDDISIFDDRGTEIEVPNPALDPEKILSYEVGLKFRSERFKGSAFFYYSDLDDLIVRQPGIFNGLTFFDLNGNGSRDAGEPGVLQRRNVGEANIKGVELDARLDLGWDFELFGNYTWTKGDDKFAGVPLGRIPPSFGKVGLRWARKSGRRPWAEFVYLAAGSQRRLSPDDMSDSRVGPSGTDRFDVFDLRGGLWVTEYLRASIALENITDQKYKYHGSGVFRPGRQIMIQAELRI